ncbi:DNA-binding transcriptional LysR family regulator [Bradyrhizobium algeriense]|uniref:DNA-binding transcriptional LysR family regulator n=2 Tax=Bradyrhizobium algeriense TaxID=634784 RepID=A0ABU8BM84_9BRAD
MNSLDALATAAEGRRRRRAGAVVAGQADLAAGHLVRLLAGYEPAPTPLHLMFQPSRLASPKIRAFVDYLVEHWRVVDPPGAQARVDR